MKILVLDNYDSFTYNLVQYIERVLKRAVDVKRNDQLVLEEVAAYDKILISPGPGIPVEAGITLDLIREYGSTKSILGVCLGHQAIAEVFGGSLINISKVFHGVSTRIRVLDREDYLYRDIPSEFDGGRYHSWIVSEEDLPASLQITAKAEDGEIMGMSHNEYDVKGVQYHPESVLTKEGMAILTNWIIS